MDASIKEISNFAKEFKRKHKGLEFFVLSDNNRRNEISALSMYLPKESTFIIRHFGDISQVLELQRPNCRIIASYDTRLVKLMPSLRFHIPSRMLRNFYNTRTKSRIFSASAHNIGELQRAANLGAKFILVSSIFKSASPSAKKIIGTLKLAGFLRASKCANIIGLGGINRTNYSRIIQKGIRGIAGVSFR